MNDIGSNSIGSIAANLDSDSQQTMFERPNHYESTSLHRDENRRYSLGREDEKSIEKDIFDPYSANPALSHQFEKLSQNDKRFLLAVERGDLPAVKRQVLILQLNEYSLFITMIRHQINSRCTGKAKHQLLRSCWPKWPTYGN